MDLFQGSKYRHDQDMGTSYPNFRGSQTRLGAFSMGLTRGYNEAPWNSKVAKLCGSCWMTSKFRALCSGVCCGAQLSAIFHGSTSHDDGTLRARVGVAA